LYDYIEGHDLTPFQLLNEFTVVSTYPRKQFDSRHLTFQEAGLTPNATVILEEVFGSDDEE
jgi:hypothetical protein